MKTKIFFVATLCATLFFGVQQSRAASNYPPVVTVNVQQIMAESTPGKQGSEHLKAVQTVLQKGFDGVQERYKSKPKAEQEKVLAEALAVLNRQMEIEKLAVASLLNKAIVEEVAVWRKANKVSLVLPREYALDVEPSADITKSILSAVNKRKITFPDLPKVNINDPEPKK